MLTETQKKLRRGKLGSSQAAAVLGLDPFQSAADVWLTLTGKVDDFAGNANTERGNHLEPAIVAWAAERIGSSIERPFYPDMMFEHDSGLMCWNADAVRIDGGEYGGGVEEAIEAKSTVDDTDLGEEGTDQIKPQWLAQVAHAMFVVPSLRVMHVPVLLPGYKKFDFRMYRCEREDENMRRLIEVVGNSGLDFMNRYVKPGVRPDDFRPSLEVVQRIRRVPSKVVPLKDTDINDFLVMRAARMQAEEDEEQAKAALIAKLDDAEAGELPDGRLVKYMLTARKGFTVEPTEFRTLRLPSKPKAPKQQTAAVAAKESA